MTFEPSAVGLDIDPRSVHLVRVVRRLGRLVVTHSSSALLPENGSGHESVIRRSMESLGLTAEQCGLAIFGRGVILNTLAVPQYEHGRRQVAEAEIKRLGFLSEEPVVTDYSSTRADTETNRVLIALAQEQAVHDALAIPDRIGLQVTQLVPIPIAMLRAAQHISGHEALHIVAHIRAESTHVLIGGRAGLLFSRRFEIGSGHFTDAVRTNSGLRSDAAEAAIQRVGFEPLSPPNPSDSTVQEALHQTADAWVAELKSTISLWRERNVERSLDDQPVTVSGPDVGIRGFLNYVGASLDRRVNPIRFNISGMTPTIAPTHTVALGLALAALDKSDRSINLIPRDRRMAVRLRVQRKTWLQIAAVLAVALLLVLAGIQWHRQELARALVVADGELRPLQTLEKEQQLLQEKNDALANQLTQAQLGTGTSRTLQALIHALGAAKHEDDWVTVIADSATYFSPEPFSQEPSNIDSPTGVDRPLSTVIVEGYTPRKNFSTVLTMIGRLRHEPCVAHADLVTDDRVPPSRPERAIWKGLDVVMFVIEIELNES